MVTFRLEERLPVTVKKESRRPWVLPCRLFTIFLQPLRILSSLQTYWDNVCSVQQRRHPVAKHMYNGLFCSDQFTWIAFRCTWTGWVLPRLVRSTSAPEWSSRPRPVPETNLWPPCTASPLVRGVSARPGPHTDQKRLRAQIEVSFRLWRWCVRSGRCSPGFPRWSRAAWWGRWRVLGRFPWWCRSSHSQAGCKGLWTEIRGGKWRQWKNAFNLLRREAWLKAKKEAIEAQNKKRDFSEEDISVGRETLLVHLWGRCPAAGEASGTLELEVSFINKKNQHLCYKILPPFIPLLYKLSPYNLKPFSI